jgi:ATP-binding cassette subfamily B protein
VSGPAPVSDYTLYRRLLRHARPYWPHVLALFLLGLLASPIALLNPVPLKIAVDSVLGSRPLPGFLQAALPEGITGSKQGVLLFAVALVVAVALVGRLRDLVYTLLKTYIGERLVLDFRGQLFDRAQRLSVSYHDTTGTADSVYRIQRDTTALSYLTVEGAVPFVSATVTVVAMIYVSVRIDVQLALVALAVVPVLFVVTSTVRHRMRSQSRQVKKLESAVQAVVQETLGALLVVKAFGQEDRETNRFVRHARRGLRARLRLTLVEGSSGVLVGLTTALGTALVLYVGVSHVAAGVLTLGQLLIVVAYLGQLYQPLRTISRKVASVQSHLASAERAVALLDEPEDVPERPNARALRRTHGAVAFRQVSFAYEPGHLVLRDVSFEAAAGTRVAIAGATGAGKSTLLSLLTRFCDPTTGAILLDGVDLREYRLADLRAQFAIVLQQPVLFSTSIAENIAYARPDASEREIIAAADAARAHDFIHQLPRGYETTVGERGMKLSGGERQRIALARAFLKDAPILILDEPTSSVDLNTEAVILEALERLMRGRTSFTVAHRLSTLENCDLLLMIKDGQLVDVTSDVSTVVKHALTFSRLEAVMHEGRSDAQA